MIFAVAVMLQPGYDPAVGGKVDLSRMDALQDGVASLDGQWEFYWDRLLTSEDFDRKRPPKMDSFITVPSTWDSRGSGTKMYPHRGVATYRLHLRYPTTIQDPAIRIQSVATAYNFYANGKRLATVGNVSDKKSAFKDAEQSLIVDLPKDTHEIELIFQVGNLNYARGGLREGPLFGSKKVLMQQKMTLLALQLFFIGSVFIFAVYYFLLFLLQRKNHSALFFSLLCFITAVRSLIWGAAPLLIFFPDVPYAIRAYINYSTGYNLMPVMLLFVLSMYPVKNKKLVFSLLLVPTLFFDALLVVTPLTFMSSFTDCLYILVLIQMVYILWVLIRAVISRKDNAILLFTSICIFILAIIEDILHYKGIGGVNVSYMFLYGNFAVMIAMSFVQAKKQASTYKRLLVYTEKLVEADKLKDKIMATEMSFLQAQIKPHFLYNALNAIANVCETDGKKAGKLILDLAVYLRGSLEFNTLDRMVTIEKELEFVDTYFNIEKARFGEKIQLRKEIVIPLKSLIPVLVLQPLVENAVRHGISKKQGGGTVTIKMSQSSEFDIIEIEDDGVGIESERLALLLNEERRETGVGLMNIHHRFIRLYGSGIEISSTIGKGTTVRLVIPNGRKNI